MQKTYSRLEIWLYSHFQISSERGGGRGVKGAGNFIGGLLEGKGAVLTATYILFRD